MLSRFPLAAKLRSLLPASRRSHGGTIDSFPGHDPADDGDGIPAWHASPVSRILSARMMEVLGVVLLIMALAIAASLFSFNPHDPSFNTATGTKPTNWLGRFGATVADGLTQLLGLAGIVPVLILLAWTWQLLRHHHLGLPLLRLAAAILFCPVAAMMIGLLQLSLPGLDVAWPTSSGIGGESGVFLARKLLGLVSGETGSMGSIVSILITLVLVAILCPMSMGLQGQEWRSVGRGLSVLFRLPARALFRPRGTAPEMERQTAYPSGAGGPIRHGRPIQGTAPLPSGFIMRNLSRQAERPTPPIAPGAPWSPMQQGAAPWQKPPSAQPPQPSPTPAPVQEEMPPVPPHDEDADNPYARMLAHIRHDPGRTKTVQRRHAEENYDDMPGVPLTVQPQELSGPAQQPGFLKRFMASASPASRSEPEQHSTIITETIPNAIPATPASPPPSVAYPAGHVPAPAHDGSVAPVPQTAPPQPVMTQAPLPGLTTPSAWLPPAISLLNPLPDMNKTGPSEETLRANAQMLEKVLDDYGVQGSITDYRAGPVVTLYELEPAPGVRSSRVIGLADDIARTLAVLSVRIATVPGRNVIGIEVPNSTRETVYFPELLLSPAWKENRSKLPLALGKDIAGEPIMADLARMPHLLVAGTTGSGKSVGINAMILSLLYRLSPEDCRLIMIDPKILELSIYDGIPHLMTPVVTEPPKAVSALKWAVQEMDRRYRLMADHGVRNISSYNDRIRHLKASGETPTRRIQTGYDPETGRPVFDEHRLPLEHLPYIVIVIDEMADLMMVAGKEIEASVLRLAQKARAAGVHVIMATQRPSVDVITGTIKANFPTRISFQVTNKYDSRTILGEQGAEQLLGRGDMLFMQGGARITRVHGPFISDEEVEAVVADLRSKGSPVYNTEVLADDEEEEDTSTSGKGGGRGSDDDQDSALYEQATELVVRAQRASTSFVQRHLRIGYNRAANIIDQMEREGVISAANHVGKRDVLATKSSLGLDRDEDED